MPGTALTVGELTAYLRLDSKHFTAGLFAAGRALQAAGRNTGRLGGQVFALGATVGATALKFGALAAGTHMVGGALAVLGGGLVTASGSLLLLPGAALAGKTALAVLKLGVDGFSDALSNMDDPAKFAESIGKLAPAARETALAVRDLKPAWDELADAVQDELFRGLGDDVRELGGAYLPLLRTGMVDVAGSFHVAEASVAGFLREAQTMRDVQSFMDSTSLATANLGGAVKPLLFAFRDIGVVGAQVFGEMTRGAAGAAYRFADFIAQARESGQLAGWITSGLQAVRELGAVLANVGGILAAVFEAASASGVSSLSVLVQATGAAREFLRSAEGMQILRQIFSGIAAAGQGLVPVLSAIAAAVGDSIAPAIARLGPMIGDAFRTLAPAIVPLGQALAALAPVIGTVAQQFAGVLARAIQAVAPIVVALAPVLQQLAALLGGALSGAIAAVTPALLVLAQALVPVVSQIAALAQQMLPVLLPLLAQIATAVAGVLVQALQLLAPLLPPLAAAFLQVVQAIMPIIPVLARIISELLPPLAALITALMPLLTGLAEVFATLAPALIPLVEMIANTVIPIITNLLNVVTSVMNAIMPIIEGAMQFIRGVIDTVMGVITGDWSRAWNGIKNIFGGIWHAIEGAISAGIDLVVAIFWELPGKILGALGDLGRLLVNAGRDIIMGLLSGLKDFAGKIWDWIKGLAKKIWDEIVDFFSILSPSKKMRWAGRMIGLGLATGLDASTDKVASAAAQLAQAGMVTVPAPRVAPLTGAAYGGRYGTAYGGDGAAASTDALGARTVVHVTNHYPQAEPTSTTVNRSLQYAGALGVI
ncbi:phage tail protein [Actinophytocola sediminis]